MNYPYYWRVFIRFPERHGQACRVLVRGGRNSCLVEFEDGFRVITSRNYVRKSKPENSPLAAGKRTESGRYMSKRGDASGPLGGEVTGRP